MLQANYSMNIFYLSSFIFIIFPHFAPLLFYYNNIYSNIYIDCQPAMNNSEVFLEAAKINE